MVFAHQRVVHLDGVVDDEAAAVFADRVAYARRMRRDRHVLPDGGLIQTDMALILGKQHVRWEGSRADEGHGLAVELDGGLGALEAGQLAFLVGDLVFSAALIERRCGFKVDTLLVAAFELLPRTDGQPDIFFHAVKCS